MTTSMARWTGFAKQADFVTPASAPTVFLNYIEECTIEPVAASELMEVEGGTRARAAARIPGTLYWRVKMTVEADSRHFPHLLIAGAGYAYSSSTHHFYFGDDPYAALTIFRYSGITGEAWSVGNCLLDTITLARDWMGGGEPGKVTLEFLGTTRDVIADPGATFSIPSTHYIPFTPHQSILLKATAGFCPLSMDLTLKNNVGPRYCGPSVDPTTSDPTYLAPTELQARKAEGTINITAQFAGYTGSIHADTITATERQYTLKLKDPSGTPTQLLWTFPRVSAPPGGVEDTITNPEQRQTIAGDLLKNSAGRIALLDVTNDEGTYA